jgi:uncharacterized membrane protein YcaP (DUF421 family)
VEIVVRAAAVYFMLMVLLRLAGRRTLSQMTSFDFALVLVLSEAVQQALVGEDYSLTRALVVVATLLLIDIALSLAKRRFPRIERVLEGLPLVLVHDGTPARELMRKARVDDADLLHAARQSQGLERLDQIRHAVLEASGGITIIPYR